MEKTMGTGSKIIIITGPESVGKTSLAKELASTFGGNYIDEYAREYISSLNRRYSYDDILHIATWQKEQFDRINEDKEGLYFVDTYLIITKIWFMWHAGEYPAWMDDSIAQTKNCLYLLCAPDIEWKSDKVRENGGENRNILYRTYRNELLTNRLEFREVKGINDLRIRNAANFVKAYL
jgi:nicotinamide riboside kinase